LQVAALTRLRSAQGGLVTPTATASPDELVVVVADEGIGMRSLTLQRDAKGWAWDSR